MVELNQELKPATAAGSRSASGVNTGEVIVGEATARQSVVIGDAVNVAARLEQHARRGRDA